MQRFIRGAFLLLPLIACAAASGQEVTFPDERFAHDQQRPAAGHWVGTMTLPGGSQSFGAILIEPVEGGEWSAQITCLVVAALRTPATAVQVGEGTIELTLESPVASLRFSGRVGDEGQSLRGTIEPLHEDEGEVGAGPGRFELGRLPRPADMPEAVSYRGSIQGMRMTFVFAETPGGHTVGHLDIPAQGLHAFPLINIEREGDEIVATIPSPVPGRLEATIGERLVGHFKQGPFNLPIDFAPPGDPAADAPPARPQHPQPPFPYGQREITVAREGFTLAGTLTTPDPAKWPPPWPAAVLISGSGQQDRDETLLGHKPFLVIADHLTRHGIAVMRYDDRGVAGSAVDDPELVSGATSADFAGDTAAIVARLRDEVNIDPDRVGLIGHSEGGIIAPMVARDDPRIAFIVLLAAPGVPGSELLPLQLELSMKAAGAPTEVAAAYRAAMAHAIELVLADAGDEAIDQALRAAARASLGAETDVPESQLDALVEGHEALLTNPWMRWFLAHDPLPVLATVRCPVFAANGALDLQVWHEQNLAAIERMAKERGIDLTARLYEGLNHLFQPATTGSGMEYAEIETTFDERVLRDMVAWIHDANVKSPSGPETRPAAEPAPSDSR